MLVCWSYLCPCQPPSSQDGTGTVEFSTDGLTGALVEDIVEGTSVDQPSDDVSGEFQGDYISLFLQWPGYGSNLLRKARHCSIERVVGGRPITRQEFAQQICLLLFSFYKMASKLKISSSQGKFGPGEDDIRLSDIVLQSVHYCSYTNTWIPKFVIVDRAGLERYHSFTTSDHQLDCLDYRHCSIQ